MTAKTKTAWQLTVLVILAIGIAGCNDSSSSGQESVNTDSVTENAVPSANAGGPYSVSEGDILSMDASLSTDSDGSITSYAWDLNNDGLYDDAFGVTTDYIASSAGDFTVGLQVTDDDGATDTDLVTITVIAAHVVDEPDKSEQGAPYEGYNLFSSLSETTAYLMDNDGNFVHSWETGYRPGNAIYLLENGELLHTGNVGNITFNAGGAGGVVRTIDWDGNITWEYEYSSSIHLQHHDVAMLPNGNILMIAWQYKTEAEALAAGRNPLLLPDAGLWPDSVIEVRPTGSSTGEIVWEWHIWDHLVQDYDAAKANFGVVGEHPELIDLNFVTGVGGADWTHINAVNYNEDTDQILLTVHNFSEIWVIDHSTTTIEAGGHSGGNSGMGGDLLYRWGNPRTYDRGTGDDQRLFVPHDAKWIAAGLPGAENILVFNNGGNRPDGNYSSVDEIILPVSFTDGSYALAPDAAYGPEEAIWSYTAEIPNDFYAQNISGAQRLPNGNTLICDGPGAYFFEVATSGEIVWEYTTTGQVFRVERYAPSYAGFDGTPRDDDQSSSRAPVADAGGPYTANVGTTIVLEGQNSNDADGWITAYAWDLDSDGLYDDANGVTANFIASSVGTYTISLQVTDNDGLTDTDSANVTVSVSQAETITFPIVDTGQTACYNDSTVISLPMSGDAFYGQDAQYAGNQPSYTISTDNLTVCDNVTGLTWTKDADWNGDGRIDADDKFTYADVQTYIDTLNDQNYGGFNDWRVPTIKELYSLIDYRGTDPNPMASGTSGLVPFIDDDVFEFAYGDTAAGERIIDSQWATCSLYVGKVMGNQQAMFGVNFADGRIKGYPAEGGPGGVDKTYYVRFCRGKTGYGTNIFVDNSNGTVTDRATDLMWSQEDSATGLNWEDALAWVQQKNDERYLGYNDWRMPNAKELQSLVDYTRSPDTTNSAAIDPVFNATRITNEAGESDYPFYWSGTTFLSFNSSADHAVYIAFGRGLGTMDGTTIIDVHGAGCQRSDPKDGDPDDFPSWGNGPQGDVQRVFNYVRLVRDVDRSL